MVKTFMTLNADMFSSESLLQNKRSLFYLTFIFIILIIIFTQEYLHPFFMYSLQTIDNKGYKKIKYSDESKCQRITSGITDGTFYIAWPVLQT